MKQKQLSEIRYGQRVFSYLQAPKPYRHMLSDLGLDPKSAQKVLADLQKHGYISKDERGMWVALRKETMNEEARISRC